MAFVKLLSVYDPRVFMLMSSEDIGLGNNKRTRISLVVIAGIFF